MATKKIKYVEPTEYIPKHIRKECKLGEFAEPKDTKKVPEKKAGTKKKVEF